MGWKVEGRKVGLNYLVGELYDFPPTLKELKKDSRD